jgi:hypothetical protein
VEDAISAHPDVLEVAVVASDLTEDEVQAFVVPRGYRPLDFDALRAWTAERISAFKVPRFWQTIESLPGRRPPGSPSSGCPPATRPRSTTPSTTGWARRKRPPAGQHGKQVVTRRAGDRRRTSADR